MASSDHGNIKAFKCPICLEETLPPIFQCVVGHSYCGECYSKLASCGECREELKGTRNFLAEQNLFFRCKYSTAGCKIYECWDIVLKHIPLCHYGPSPCPFRDMWNCTAELEYPNRTEHWVSSHDGNIFTIPDEKETQLYVRHTLLIDKTQASFKIEGSKTLVQHKKNLFLVLMVTSANSNIYFLLMQWGGGGAEENFMADITFDGKPGGGFMHWRVLVHNTKDRSLVSILKDGAYIKACTQRFVIMNMGIRIQESSQYTFGVKYSIVPSSSNSILTVQMNHTYVFMEFKAEDTRLGRIVFQLRNDIADNTSKNFGRLCAAQLGFGYKGTKLDVIDDECFCGGEKVNCEPFIDENFTINHTTAGILSSYSHSHDVNGAGFQVSFEKMPSFDGRFVAFGFIVEGMCVLRKIESYGTSGGTPKQDIFIEDCGELKMD